jgi:hypothetical protein
MKGSEDGSLETYLTQKRYHMITREVYQELLSKVDMNVTNTFYCFALHIAFIYVAAAVFLIPLTGWISSHGKPR